MPLDPNYIVGFVDGEGCFSITVNRGKKNIPEVRLLFEIEVREDDEDILRQIQSELGCGSIYRLEYERYEKWRPHVKYKVANIRDISDKIIPFFTRYPLKAKKQFSFQKFCLATEMMHYKEHLTAEGVNKILKLRHIDSPDALDAHVRLRRKKSEDR